VLLHGADRASHCIGGLGETHVIEAEQRDGQSLLEGQAVDGVADAGLQLGSGGVLGRAGRRVRRGGCGVPRQTASAFVVPELPDRAVRGDPPDPATELVAPVVLVDSLIRSHEALLNGVLGILRAGHNRVRNPTHRSAMAAH
jgi:hypothetical protein